MTDQHKQRINCHNFRFWWLRLFVAPMVIYVTNCQFMYRLIDKQQVLDFKKPSIGLYVFSEVGAPFYDSSDENRKSVGFLPYLTRIELDSAESTLTESGEMVQISLYRDAFYVEAKHIRKITQIVSSPKGKHILLELMEHGSNPGEYLSHSEFAIISQNNLRKISRTIGLSENPYWVDENHAVLSGSFGDDGYGIDYHYKLDAVTLVTTLISGSSHHIDTTGHCVSTKTCACSPEFFLSAGNEYYVHVNNVLEVYKIILPKKGEDKCQSGFDKSNWKKLIRLKTIDDLSYATYDSDYTDGLRISAGGRILTIDGTNDNIQVVK